MSTQPDTISLPVSAARRFLKSPWLAPFNSADDWNRPVSLVNPLWASDEPRAEVVRVVDEAPGVKSVWLKPNRRFRGFRPGQHVLLELDINGARHARCFSFSSSPRPDGLLRLTIKRKDNGPVSAAAHALQPGQVVRLGQAKGLFSPSGVAPGLLLVAAGSGVTPMISLLEGFAAEASSRDIVLLYCCRAQDEVIFASEITTLTKRMPGLKVLLHFTRDQGRLDAGKIGALVSDWKEREALACGPDGFMRVVELMHAESGLDRKPQCESFGRRAAAVDANAAAHLVRYDSSEQLFTVLAGQSLLDGAEAAGLQPRYGCRRGICRTCQCRKRSGTVVNLLTGQVSGPGEELIQLCISTPQSAVELAR